MARLLIVANDVIASRMAGPGIRCFEVARELSRRGHEVTVAGVSTSDLEPKTFKVVARASPVELDRLARLQDAILLEGISLVRYPSLRRVPVPLIVDLYDPFPFALLEQEAHLPLELQELESVEVRKVLQELLRGGDFFLCASETQRDLWSGALLQAGRINPRTWERDNSLRDLVDVVPFGLPSAPPLGTRQERNFPFATFYPSDILLIWGGGIYNWFDPLTLIRAVAQVASLDPRVKLIFMATDHPNGSIPDRMWMPQRARELSAELGLTGRHVFFNKTWVPYDDRGRWLRAADCGVSTHFAHAETRYAFRTRLLDYLWCGLPMICTEGDHFAKLISDRGLGWVVHPEDIDGLALAIREMAGDVTARSQMAQRVEVLAGEMTWEKVISPLHDFLNHPCLAADSPRERWINRRAPTSLELRGAAVLRLAATAWRELAHNGPSGVLDGYRRWLRHRRAASETDNQSPKSKHPLF